MTKFVAIVARQRSGSNYLRSLISSLGGIADMDEILGHWNYRDRVRSDYFTYQAEAFRSAPDLSVPSRENIEALFGGYLDHLAATFSEHRYILLDIKYNSTHHFNPVWHSTFDRPFLFDLLKKFQVATIHLVRNVFFGCCSKFVADANQRWYVRADESFEPQPVTIDPATFLWTMRHRDAEIRFMKEHIFHVPKRLEVRYEEIAKSTENFVTLTLPKLENLLEADFSAGKATVVAGFKKMIRDPRQLITNYSVIEEAVLNSELAHLL